MNTVTVDLNCNDRFILHIAGRERPYCIYRVLELWDEQTVVYASIMKKSFTLSAGSSIEMNLDHFQIVVTFDGFIRRGTQRNATFTIRHSSELLYRKLGRMEAKRNA